MSAFPSIQLSPQFSYDALASFFVLEAREPRPCGDAAAPPPEDVPDPWDVARARLLEFLTTGGRPNQT